MMFTNNHYSSSLCGHCFMNMAPKAKKKISTRGSAQPTRVSPRTTQKTQKTNAGNDV